MKQYSMDNKKELYSELLKIMILFMVATGVRFLFSDFSKSIYVYGDEIRYYGIARSIFQGSGLSFRNAETNFQKILYSLVLAPFFSISDGIIRMKVFSFVNSIIMCSSVFPAWLLSKELQLCKKERYLVCLITLLWPDMLFSMTFMSEVLFWPLFLWFVYVWMLNRKLQSCLLGIFEGILCYIGYMCKEIFLAMFLAYIIFEMTFPLLEYLLTHKKYVLKEKLFSRRIFVTLVFVGVFLIIYVLIKTCFFSGMGNSYNQMGLSAILTPYKFIYMIYGFLYYIAAVLLASLIFPVIHPVMNFKKLHKNGQQLFYFSMLFLLISSATIAYTITVREDLGKIIPRLHMRYIGPLMVLLFISLFHSMQMDSEKRKFQLGDFLIIVLALSVVCVIFKGIGQGSIADQYSLQWYLAIQKVIGTLSIDNSSLIIYLYVIVINAIIFLISCLLYSIYICNKKAMKHIFFLMTIAVCTINNLIGGYRIKKSYFIEPICANKIIELNKYFLNMMESHSILYLTTNSGLTRLSKYFDTYFDDIQNLYMIDCDTFFTKALPDIPLDVSEINMSEPIYHSRYSLPNGIDYIIVEDGINFGCLQLGNTELVTEMSSEYYTVYENLNPDSILLQKNKALCFNGEDLDVFFFGENYNADLYIEHGIYSKENNFSWTSGNIMSVKIPVSGNYENLNVSLTVGGTFHGKKSYIVKTKNEVILAGDIDGDGEISFNVTPENGELLFEILLPNAEVVKEIYKDSSDNRKISLQLQKMSITNKE